MRKSNVVRLLAAQQIPFHLYTFSSDIRSAEGVAQVMGIPPQEVYKTLVVLPPRGRPLLVVIPGHRTLDLKRLAQAVGEKKLRMATQQEAEALTGLQVGGISALALLHRGFRVYLDRSAQAVTDFVVSAGQRGVDLRLRVEDFVRVTRARFVEAVAEG